MRLAQYTRGPSMRPRLMASRTATSVNQVPPGTEMLVTPERNTFCAFQAAAESIEFRSGCTFSPVLARQFRVAVGKVGVGVDQTRHNPLSAGVDDLYVVCVVQLDFGRQRPRAFDAIALDHNG